MIHNHWLRTTHNESQPLAQHNTTCVTTTRTAYHNMIQNHWLSIAHHDSQPLAAVVVNHGKLWWASGCVSWCVIHEPMVVNHVVSFWPSGRESWWVMLSQWLWIIVSYAEPVGVNHMLNQWFGIMVCFAEAVLVNHGVLFSAVGCESWWVMLSHYHWLRIANHGSQSPSHHNTPWSTTTGSP
jgi:hypothetical protein